MIKTTRHTRETSVTRFSQCFAPYLCDAVSLWNDAERQLTTKDLAPKDAVDESNCESFVCDVDWKTGKDDGPGPKPLTDRLFWLQMVVTGKKRGGGMRTQPHDEGETFC